MIKLDDRLAELLVTWEESLSEGTQLTTAVLCRDCPELTATLEREIGRLRAIDQFLFPPSNGERGKPPDPIDEAQPRSRMPHLAGYEILEELGRGGMGVVYKARQQSLGRLVAIKTLTGSRWSQPGFLDRLRQEAKALSNINHPNVIKVIDVIETDHAVSVVLEYVEGESLARRQGGIPLSSLEAARITLALANTMAAVHGQGILHRDLKPANVLFSRSGEIKIADFGLAKEAGTAEGLTVTGELLGSPGYMAPEQAEGRPAAIDERTDVYALGATLYEMLTGRPPFIGGSVVETLDQVRQRDPISPRLLNPAVPRDLETICLKCMEKDPARRISTADELAEEMGRYLRGEPIRARPIGAAARGWRWCRRRPAAASLVGVSALALVVIVAGLFAYNRELTRLNGDLETAATTARAMQTLAEEREREAKETAYAIQMTQAATAWREGDTRTMLDLLDSLIPYAGERDLRGFEWWYLRRQLRVDRRPLLEVGSPQYTMCYSPDQRLVAMAGQDSVLRLFDPKTGQLTRELPTGQIEINGIAFSSDGKEIATAGDDGTIRIWSRESWTARLTFRAQPEKAFQLVYTADGKHLVSCGDNPLIRVFDSQTGREVRQLPGHARTVQSLSMDEVQKTVASTSSDGSARIWDLQTWQEVGRIPGKLPLGPAVLLASRHLLIVGLDSGEIQTWNLVENKKLSSVRHLDKLASLAVHPDGRLLAAGDGGGSVRLWQLSADGKISPESILVWQAHRGCAQALLWSPDGGRLISTGDDGRVMSWEFGVASDRSITKLNVSASDDLALIPGTHWLATQEKPESLVIRNWQSGSTVAKTDGFDELLVEASPDGRWLAVFNRRELRLIRIIERDRPLPALSTVAEWRPTGELKNVRFSPNSQKVGVIEHAKADAPSTGEYSLSTLALPGLDQIEHHPVHDVSRVAFSPDSGRLALRTGVNLAVWDNSNGKLLWETAQADADYLRFSPNGMLVISRDNLRNVVVRDARDGAVRFRLTGQRAEIASIAISPDGRTLATAAENGVIKLSHLPTGRDLFDLHVAEAACAHLEFAEDGRHLLCRTRTHLRQPRDEILVFAADGANDHQ